MRFFNFVAGFGLGITSAYFLDPSSGRRRRALCRDQCVHLMKNGRKKMDRRLHDAWNRSSGKLAEARGRVMDGQVVDDRLERRVRAAMGHAASNPAAISVSAHDGVVRLIGGVRARERRGLLHAVKAVRGVRGVEDDLITTDRA